ncbi:MAG: N-acetylmuramic acid 6-phosphate etherase [Erysipelotrichaceae bacterium]|nr:N-acetylmuramic acid 6-phosphate etherase [Erysipelotrichaceae bacterium]
MKETEMRNPDTMDIDRCSALEIVEKINHADSGVAASVGTQKAVIAGLIEACAERMKKGGRLIYMGAGTSGRLGVLDASECPPTYGVSPDLVVGLIAGGRNAVFKAVEGAEDSKGLGVKDLKDIGLTALDTVVGLAASGSTPYVIGGLEYAGEIGACRGSVACVSDALISKYADYAIEAVTGPEVITGSTRMKAGTAEKMICNMISTGVMIKYGKVYENLMVDVQPTNIKLVGRSKRIIAQAVNCDAERAAELFEESGHDVKIAILMGLAACSREEAETILSRHGGNVREAIDAER